MPKKRKLTKKVLAILILSLILSIEVTLTYAKQTDATTIAPTYYAPSFATPIATPSSIPEKIIPPNYIPKLREYDIDKSHNIWHAKNPSSYITPNNEWVRYYALLYEKYQNGENILVPQIYYLTDAEIYPNNPDKDYWQNADYTISTGVGDCEDIAIAKVSMHRFLGHKAIVVGGDIIFSDRPNIRDFWYEIYTPEKGVERLKFTNPSVYSYNTFSGATPMYMFNDEILWRNYNENWYK